VEGQRFNNYPRAAVSGNAEHTSEFDEKRRKRSGTDVIYIVTAHKTATSTPACLPSTVKVTRERTTTGKPPAGFPQTLSATLDQ